MMTGNFAKLRIYVLGIHILTEKKERTTVNYIYHRIQRIQRAIVLGSNHTPP